jgi:glycosyltransferase involved in cell wall biosynthesis
MSNETIVVFIPSARAKIWLQHSIGSILQQNWDNIDIYVVDDASGDVDVALITLFPSVTFLRMRNTVGPYVINNMLLKLTQSGYVAFQDADDWSHPNRFEIQMEYLHHHKLDGCGAWSTHLDIYGDVIGYETLPARITSNVLRNYRYPLRHPSGMYFRYLFDDLKGFDNGTIFGADSEFIFRSSLTFEIGNVQKFLYRHRVHPQSLTQNIHTGFGSDARNTYTNSIQKYMDSILAGELSIPKLGKLVTGEDAGSNYLPDYELLQLGEHNTTWNNLDSRIANGNDNRASTQVSC